MGWKVLHRIGSLCSPQRIHGDVCISQFYTLALQVDFARIRSTARDRLLELQGVPGAAFFQSTKAEAKTSEGAWWEDVGASRAGSKGRLAEATSLGACWPVWKPARAAWHAGLQSRSQIVLKQIAQAK